MKNPIRSGFKFVNEGLDFIVILTNGTEKNNVALLMQENTFCPFISRIDMTFCLQAYNRLENKSSLHFCRNRPQLLLP